MQPIRYGKYELIERIARGGMAEVYKARVKGAAGFEKLVAVKKLHAHLSEDIEMVNMLKDEARLVSNMVHPNICAVLDLDRVEDTYYLAMEYIHGKDVSTISRFERHQGRKVPLDIALYIIRQTLTGLDYAHRMTDPVSGMPLNIIHRDISPQNIIVAYNGGVKIIDFGIAKAAESLHHTQSGVIKGKFRYMASEQATGKHIDHRVDIFAAGVMLYELITGDVHSRGASDAQLIIQAQTGHFEPLGRLVKDLPLGLELAVMKSLSPDRDNRFPSARTFRNALDTIVQREGLEVAPEAVASYLTSLFPDPFSKGSRVDEVEQLSARDLQEFSGEMAPQGGGGFAPVPMGAPRTASGGYAGDSNPPPSQYNYYSDPGPAPSMPVDLPPPPGAQQYDYFGRSQVAQGQQQPLEPTKTALPQDFEKVEANPVGLTRATSESGRERRRRERLQQREEQQRKEEEYAQAVEEKDFAAIPAKPREPFVGPFLDRLVKALGATLVNILFLFALIGIGAGIFKYTRSKERDDKRANDAVTQPKKGTKRCTRGLVYITIRTTPAGADLFFEGMATGVKSPVSNVEYNMCFNQPLLIRAEKGALAGEASVSYPLKGKNVSVSIKLSKNFKSGQGAVVTPGAQSQPTGTQGDSSGGSASGGSRGGRSSSRHGTKGMSVSVPGDAKPVNASPDAPEVAGGIGILKVSCSQKCTPIVDGRSKGAAMTFRLRARKAPYSVKAKFSDGTFAPAQKVYIQPYQDNFVRFSK